MQPQTKKQLELLLYKISNDALLLWIIFFAGLLIFEGLVPGYFSAYLSFTKMILALFALLAIIGYLGKRHGIVFELPSGREFLKNKISVALLVVSFALIVNSLRGSGWLVMAMASIGTFFALVLLYKVLIVEEK